MFKCSLAIYRTSRQSKAKPSNSRVLNLENSKCNFFCTGSYFAESAFAEIRLRHPTDDDITILTSSFLKLNIISTLQAPYNACLNLFALQASLPSHIFSYLFFTWVCWHRPIQCYRFQRNNGSSRTRTHNQLLQVLCLLLKVRNSLGLS